MSNILELEKKAFEAFRPPKKLNLSDWANEHAFLSAESSAESGRWHTLPYQKGIMNAITDPNIEQVTVMKSARVGYSKILNHIVGYHIHQDPCPIMLVQPTEADAQSYSKEEISPMIRDTPVLNKLISEAKTRDSNNTILQKLFPGGSLSLVGANSPRGFRRVSRRIVLFDEVDGYPISGAGSEGDQIKLGIKRTDFYVNRKIVAGSTPTIKDFSRIEKLFNQTDQKRYYVPCPKCNHFQYLQWPNFKWFDNDPETVGYKCQNCGDIIHHSKKRWMIERGEWRSTQPGNGKHVGFHIWAGYSYSPNASWPNLVEEFLSVKNDPEQLKTFINITLGETWEDEYAGRVGADALMERAASEDYKQGVPPENVVVLTMGCDVQDDRLSMSVFGWARGQESYLIDRIKIYGLPSQPAIWKQLDEILQKPYKTVDGRELKISITAIDTGGHFTQDVYAYARERYAMGVIAIKGMGMKTAPALGKPKKQDISFSGKAMKKGVKLFPLGVDRIKNTLNNRLKHAEKGEGYLHFYPTITSDYFEEYLAERQVLRYKNGFQERVWMKKSQAPNEAWDEAVYGYAALLRFLQSYDPRTVWDQLEKKKTDNKPNEASPLISGRQKGAKKRNFVANW